MTIPPGFLFQSTFHGLSLCFFSLFFDASLAGLSESSFKFWFMLLNTTDIWPHWPAQKRMTVSQDDTALFVYYFTLLNLAWYLTHKAKFFLHYSKFHSYKHVSKVPLITAIIKITDIYLYWIWYVLVFLSYTIWLYRLHLRFLCLQEQKTYEQIRAEIMASGAEDDE